MPYTRFVKLINRAFPALVCLLKSLAGEITDYLFIDSTPMAVYHNLREKKHKTFKHLVDKGKTSTGWFFGLKLHLLFNTLGEIVPMTITSGDAHDMAPVRNMMKGIATKLIG